MQNIHEIIEKYKQLVARRGKYLEEDKGKEADALVSKIIDLSNLILEFGEEGKDKFSELMGDDNPYVQVAAALVCYNYSELKKQALAVLNNVRDAKIWAASAEAISALLLIKQI